MRRFSDVKEVFDLFDFWDGRDGLVDGAKVGDLLRCCQLNPTNKLVFEHGGTKKLGNLNRTHARNACGSQISRFMHFLVSVIFFYGDFGWLLLNLIGQAQLD